MALRREIVAARGRVREERKIRGRKVGGGKEFDHNVLNELTRGGRKLRKKGRKEGSKGLRSLKGVT